MAPRTGVKLPGWAKLIRPKKQPSSTMTRRKPLDTREEEAYMRKRCYHILSKDMDDVMVHVLQEALAPSLELLQDYLDAAAPPSDRRSKTASSFNNTPQPTSRRKRQRLFSSATSPTPAAAQNHQETSLLEPPSSLLLEGLDSQLFDEQQEPQTPHDPLLLPIVVLQGPSFGLDRKAQADCIVKSLRNSRTHSAVVKVEPQHRHRQQRGGGSGRNTSTNWMMQELVRQCHAQVPVLSTESLKRRITKRIKKKACTFSDMLLLWAQHITCYDEIVIVLDADESFYSTELQDFLHILAARRSEHGIPLTVVMMGPHDGRRTMELRSTSQGYAGFMIRSVSLPSPSYIVDQFWKRLYLKRQFPILLPPVVLAAIHRSFTYHHSSFCKASQTLKQALAYHFTQRGSLLTVANDPSILAELWQRLAWFCVAEELTVGKFCREILVSADSEAISSQRILEVVGDEGTRQQEAQLVLHLMASVSQAKKTGNKLNVFNPTFQYLLDNVTRRDMLEHLVQLREQISTGNNHRHNADVGKPNLGHKAFLAKYITCMPLEEACSQEKDFKMQQLAKKQNFVNELIVLVGNCRDGDSSLSEIEQLLDETLGRWINHRCDANTGKEPSSEWDWLTEKDWVSLAESFSPEPRHQTVAALLRGHSPADRPTSNSNTRSNHLSLFNVAGTMYRVIRDRVAVTQEDWYEEFWQRAIVEAAEDVSRDKSFAQFSLGLRYLKQCGFISEKLRVGSRSDIIYERAKLVWCGGD